MIATPTREAQKLRAFISYSRRDEDFAGRLVDALKSHDIEAIIDKNDLPKLEDWERELAGLILGSDAVIFIVSTSSLESKVVRWEMDQAIRHAKRMAPIVIEQVSVSNIPQEVARINFIFFEDPAKYEECVLTLVASLKTDIGWVKEHTRLADRADRWLLSRKTKDHLLGGIALAEAERWLANKPHSSPSLSKNQVDFIVSSQRNRVARQRRFVAAATLLSIGALGAATFSWHQRNQALTGQSKILASVAEVQSATGNQGAALNIAIEALPLSGAIWERPIVPEAVVALHNSLFSLRERHVYAEHKDKVNSLSIALRGKVVASGSDDHTVVIRSGPDFSRGKILEGHTDAVEVVRVAPSGAFVASGSADTTVRLWDAQTGELLQTLTGLGSSVISLGFHRTEKRLIAGATDGGVVMWSFDGRARALEGHQRRVNTAIFGSNQPWALTASDDGTVKLWDSASANLIGNLDAGEQAVVGASFLPDEKSAAAWSFDGTIRIWSLPSGSLSSTTVAHSGPVRVFRFCDLGNCLLTAGDDGFVKIWDLDTLSAIRSLDAGDAIWSADVADGLVAAVTRGGQILVWEIASGKLIRKMLGHDDWIYDVGFFDDPTRGLLTASRDGTLREWSLYSSPLAQELKGHNAAIYSFRFSADGSKFVTASADGTWKLWSTKDLQLMASGKAKAEIRDAAVESTLSVVVALDSLNGINVFDATTGALIRSWTIKDSAPGVVLINKFGDVITGSADGALRIWDMLTGSLKLVKRVHARDIVCLDHGPSQALIIACSLDGSVAIHSLLDDGLIFLRGHTKAVRSAAFSTSGRRALTASEDGTIRVWDAVTGAVLNSTTVSAAGVTDVSETSDGNYVLAAGLDGIIRVFETSRMTMVAQYRNHADTVTQAKFVLGGVNAVSVSADGEMHKWSLLEGGPPWADQASHLVPRCLSTSQRAQFYLPPSVPRYCNQEKR